MDSIRLYVIAVDRAEKRAGAGWNLLGADLRQALVAVEVLKIISQNDEIEGYQKAALLADHVLTD